MQLWQAPMVGQSDLAFRLLCRKHGTQVTYTEMLMADRFAADPEYRKRSVQFDPDHTDRPLFV